MTTEATTNPVQPPTARVVIVGAGAAGMMAAIWAKSQLPHTEVVVLEKAPKPLGKVKISGGGRCNVTHRYVDDAQFCDGYPRGSKAMRGRLNRFSPLDVVQWFEDRGVRLKTEPDGRLFPVTDESQTIIDCLLQQAQQAGVVLRTQTPMLSLTSRPEGGWMITTGGLNADTLITSHVILASGASEAVWQQLQQLGLKILDPVPSLFTFEMDDPRLDGLAGVSVQQVSVKLKFPESVDLKKTAGLTQQGPFLITHWGVSGPAVLKLSAWGARGLAQCDYRASLMVDFLPHIAEPEVLAMIQQPWKAHPQKQVANMNPFVEIPNRLWERLIEYAGMRSRHLGHDVSKKQQHRLVELLKHSVFAIEGKGPFKEEFVKAGGVDIGEIDPATMQCKRFPGLYVVGELVDIDGITGGFNFQHAWSTGKIAGCAVAESINT